MRGETDFVCLITVLSLKSRTCRHEVCFFSVEVGFDVTLGEEDYKKLVISKLDNNSDPLHFLYC